MLEEKYEKLLSDRRREEERKEAERNEREARETAERTKKSRRAKVILISLLALFVVIVAVRLIVWGVDKSVRAGVVYELTPDRSGYYVYGVEDNNIEKVTILSEYNGKPVTEIGSWAFSYCKNIKSVTVPSSISVIGDYAFYKCESLTEVVISENAKEIGDYAFANCTSLESITIPRKVTTIGGGAFYLCTALKSVKFEVAAGWTYGSLSPTEIMPSKLSDNMNAASLLVDEYSSFMWKRT